MYTDISKDIGHVFSCPIIQKWSQWSLTWVLPSCVIIHHSNLLSSEREADLTDFWPNHLLSCELYQLSYITQEECCCAGTWPMPEAEYHHSIEHITVLHTLLLNLHDKWWGLNLDTFHSFMTAANLNIENSNNEEFHSFVTVSLLNQSTMKRIQSNKMSAELLVKENEHNLQSINETKQNIVLTEFSHCSCCVCVSFLFWSHSSLLAEFELESLTEARRGLNKVAFFPLRSPHLIAILFEY